MNKWIVLSYLSSELCLVKYNAHNIPYFDTFTDSQVEHNIELDSEAAPFVLLTKHL